MSYVTIFDITQYRLRLSNYNCSGDINNIKHGNDLKPTPEAYTIYQMNENVQQKSLLNNSYLDLDKIKLLIYYY